MKLSSRCTSIAWSSTLVLTVLCQGTDGIAAVGQPDCSVIQSLGGQSLSNSQTWQKLYGCGLWAGTWCCLREPGGRCRIQGDERSPGSHPQQCSRGLMPSEALWRWTCLHPACHTNWIVFLVGSTIHWQRWQMFFSRIGLHSRGVPILLGAWLGRSWTKWDPSKLR